MKEKIKISAGIIIVILVVELGLRLNFYLKDSLDRPILTTQNNSSTHILVLGDSISSLYPGYLEKNLSQSFPHKSFKVFNRCNSLKLLSLASVLPAMIKETKPNYAFVMFGAQHFNHLNEENMSSQAFLFLNHFMVIKLLKEKGKEAYLFVQSTLKYFSEKKKAPHYDFDSLEKNLYNSYVDGSLTKEKASSLIEDIKEMSLSRPEDRKKALALYWCYLAVNDIQSAASLLHLTSMSNDKVLSTHLNGYLALEKKDFALAEKHFNELIQNISTLEQGCIDLANFYYLTGNDKEKVRLLLSCSEKLPDSHRINNELGFFFYRKGNIKKAWSYVQENLKRQESGGAPLSQTYFLKGLLLEKENNIEPSIEAVEKAIRLSPNSQKYYSHYFFLVQRHLRDFTSNISFLEEIRPLTHYKEDLDYFKNLFISFMENEKDQARALSYQDSAGAKLGGAISLGDISFANKVFLQIADSYQDESPNSYTINGYEAIFKILRSHNVTVVVLQYPDQKVSLLKDSLKKHEGVYYFDTYSYLRKFVAEGKNNAADFFMADGFHLTELGSQKLAEGIAQLFH